MRKIPIALISILIASISNLSILGQNSFALYQEDDITWWTAEELLDFSKEVDAETEAICGNNIGCRQNYYYSNLEGDNPKYRALDRLYQTQFRVTSINPEEETMDILFLDQDAMLRQMGIDEHHPLEYIFMAWFYEHNPNITNYYYAYPDEEQFPDDLHTIYSSDNYLGGTFPSNQIFTLPINKTNLRDNPLNRIYVATFGEQYNSMGSIDYASCLRAPDYTPGTKCQLLISADYGEKFLPPRNTLLQSNELAVTMQDPSEQTSNENEEEQQKPDDNAEEAGYGSEEKDTKVVQKNNDLIGASTAKVPETGTATKEEGNASDWWLGLVIAPSILALIWLCLPISSKSPKNNKKSVDKNNNLR